MTFEQFMEENGHRLLSARQKMGCLVRHTTSFWNQDALNDPDILDTDIKALWDAATHYLEGIKELTLYQTELKKLWGKESKQPEPEKEEPSAPIIKDDDLVVGPPIRPPASLFRS